MEELKYPNLMFIHYNEYYNEFECSDTTCWTNEVEYILKSDNKALTATIAQKDAEIELLKFERQELLDVLDKKELLAISQRKEIERLRIVEKSLEYQLKQQTIIIEHYENKLAKQALKEVNDGNYIDYQ